MYIAYKWCHFSCDWPIKEGTLENKAPSLLYLGFNSRDFPETPQISLYTHHLQMVSMERKGKIEDAWKKGVKRVCRERWGGKNKLNGRRRRLWV